MKFENDQPYLGYQLSNDLNTAKHISIITGKANRTLGFLRRNLRKCPMDLKSTAYKSLVRSVLEYAASAWDSYLAKDEHQLEMVQRRAARFVMNDYWQKSSDTEMLNQLGWSKPSRRQREARLILLFKIVKGLVAVEFDQLTPNTSRTTKSNSHNFTVIPTSTNQYKHSFLVRTVKDWNHLDDRAVTCNIVDAFSSHARKD